VPPKISIVDYLRRLARFVALTPPLLLSIVYYADQLCSFYPAFTVTSLTAHRFLITAATVAAKGLSDSFWDNDTYAYVGGVSVLELGILELEFLFRVDWKVVPKPDTLVEYYQALVKRAEGYTLEGGCKPGGEGTIPTLPL
jgi:Cyclin